MKTKRMILALCAGLLCFAHTANAQWVVTDPTNFAGNIANSIKEIVQTSTTAQNMIKNVQESVKIYQQGKEYYDKLKSVHSIVKDARKVQKTIEMVGEITDIYFRNFQKMLGDPNFTPGELEAISNGYTKLMGESGALVTELKNVVTGGNGLSMSDKERMDAVDKIYVEMRDYRNMTKYFTDKSISVSYIRAKEKNDAQRVLSLYGTPEERYW